MVDSEMWTPAMDVGVLGVMVGCDTLALVSQ